MIYKIKRKINIVEKAQSFKQCPDATHSHLANFTIKISSNLPESDVLENLEEVISENIVYMEDKWSLKLLAETMKKELISSGFDIKQVNLFLEDMQQIEVETYA